MQNNAWRVINILAAFFVGLAAGIAATPHCLGMCGGFPLYLASSTERNKGILHQLLFVLGKCFTYAFLGAMAGWLGIVIFENTWMKQAAPYVRLAAGILIVAFGLSMLGLRLPGKQRVQIDNGDIMIKGISGLLSSGKASSAFILGLAVGFLPCPLPMGMLAIAASNHSVLNGIILMTGVGFGTMPGLLAVGLFGTGINKKFAKYGMQLAGIVVLAIGLLIFSRAAYAVFNPHSSAKAASCCSQEHSPK